VLLKKPILMAIKKALQQANLASKALKQTVKTAALNAVTPKKGGAAAGKTVIVQKQAVKSSDRKEIKVAEPPIKKANVVKLTKSPAVVSTVKEETKLAVKKLKEPVKKTPIADKNEGKAVAVKKEATPEKKSKADPLVEKEAKKTSKVAKGESDTEKGIKPVVIPKTSTTKKVDYQPDFLKSVLDTPAIVPQGPTMRYSDTELQEFKDLINKKLDAAKKELAYLQGLITRRDEMGGDETDNRYMTMEDGGMSMEREQLSQMASRQITFIDHLEKAIMRIENKTYGICRVTGKLIDKARLRAVPHATLSMEAKLGITK
jgi:RNA polymerase-binding transcription factor DksA